MEQENSAKRSKKHILIIEDEKFLVDMMKLRLEAAGYEVSFAYDGEEGLAMIGKRKPDLILLDIIMPKLDGFAVCRYVKGNANTKNIPIVVVSASGGKDLPDKCFAAGANDFILKPFDPKNLLDKIAKNMKSV